MVANVYDRCQLCKEKDPEKFKIYFDGHIKLYRCCTCGLVAQYPGPGLFTIKTNYEEDYTMPIRLAQARLIPQDSYVRTRLRKTPCRAEPLIGRHGPTGYAPGGKPRPSHQGKDAETPTEPRVI